MDNSFIALIEESIKKNWELDALTDFKGATLRYKDVARKIAKMHIILEDGGILVGKMKGAIVSHLSRPSGCSLGYRCCRNVPEPRSFRPDTACPSPGWQ